VVWVIVFGSIGLAGAIMLICYAVWLGHKASDLFSELEMLSRRADERAFQPDWHSDRTIPSQN
jgi:hypothetical protein